MTCRPILSCVLTLALAASANAAPYCAPMLDADLLESRYQRLAPIFNSAETGWIFGSDQLEYRYVLSATEAHLLSELVAELAARGTELAIVVPPPRPVVAGQATVEATTGVAGRHDIAAQARAFEEMLGQIAATGAVVPNLLDLATADPALTAAYYFQRDTHWTNLGAAHSALALAAALGMAQPGFDPHALPIVEEVAEPGSLSRIVTATCDLTPEAELSPLFDYSAHLPDAGGLLGDAGDAGADVMLLGTSFSDRYGRDQYQFADALAAALGQPVENRSVSGGGMIGPFETFLQTGAYAGAPPALIVWEFPSTYQLQEVGLRRLLGALRASDALAPFATAALGPETTRLDVPGAHGAASLLGLRMVEGRTRDMVLRLHLEDGEDLRLRLRRNSRMEEVAILDTWWLDLRGLSAPVAALEIELRGDGDLSAIELLSDAGGS